MQTIEGKRLTLFSLYSYVQGIKQGLDELQDQFEKQVDNESNQTAYFNLIQVVESLSESIDDISDRLTTLERKVDGIPVTPMVDPFNEKTTKKERTWIYKFFKRRKSK